MKPKKAVLTLGFFAFVLFLSAPAFLNPPQNPDLFWHLSAGREIVRSGTIPRTDFLSWTLGGKPWTDFEWLTQVCYFLLYSKYGLAGLQALKLLFCGGAAAFLLLLLRLHGMGFFFPAVFTVWAAALCPTLDIRPDNATLFFFTAELYLLERLRLGKTSAPPFRLFLFTLPLFALWTNLHAGVMYGIVLAAIMAAGELMSALFRPVERTAHFKTAALGGAIAASGALGACLTPFGTAVYSVALTHQADMKVLSEKILEWMPPPLTPFQYFYWALIGGGLLSGLSMVWRRKPEWFHLLSFTFFGVMSLQHMRHTMFAVTAALALLTATGSAHKDKSRKTLLLVCGTALVSALFLINKLTRFAPPAQPFIHLTGTQGITAFLEQNTGALGKLNMFNPWGWGGYLGWKLHPAYRIFQDGRYIFHNFIPEIYDAQTSDRKWQEFLNRKKIDLALLDGNQMLREQKITVKLKDGSSRKIERPIYCYYMPRKEWALVFYGGNDDTGLVFARRSAVDPAWLKANEIKWARPLEEPAVRLLLQDKIIKPLDLTQDMALLSRNAALSPNLSAVTAGWRDLLQTTSAPQSLPQ